MSESYRVLSTHEESRRERLMANLGFKFFSLGLGIPDDVPVRFIAPSSYGGEFRMENRVLGLARGSREIYLLAALPDHDLITTLCHEARHIFQAISGKHCLDSETRERDARLYVFEVNVPRMEGRELRVWLLREIEFLKNPELRVAYARAEAVMRPRKTAESMRPELRSEIASSKGERINYIRKLLATLPAQSKFQRANLEEELNELLRIGAVAA